MKIPAGSRLSRAQLLASMLALGLARAAPAFAQRRASADSVRIVTSDISRFWKVLDGGIGLDLDARLRDEYLAPGSAGLRAFAPREIGSALDLARVIFSHQSDYFSSRTTTLNARAAEPEIRSMMRRLQALYPEAVLLDVYVVIGRHSVGGWTRGDTLVVAAEMYPSPAALPVIVAHELVHRQQPAATGDQTLLERSFHEGSADFVGALISGATINVPAQQYGRAHEHELWREFQGVMNGHEYLPWLYGGVVANRPADLGYFFGYRIAQSYYDRADDKATAVREILRVTDITSFLTKSGYAP